MKVSARHKQGGFKTSKRAGSAQQADTASTVWKATRRRSNDRTARRGGEAVVSSGETQATVTLIAPDGGNSSPLLGEKFGRGLSNPRRRAGDKGDFWRCQAVPWSMDAADDVGVGVVAAVAVAVAAAVVVIIVAVVVG